MALVNIVVVDIIVEIIVVAVVVVDVVVDVIVVQIISSETQVCVGDVGDLVEGRFEIRDSCRSCSLRCSWRSCCWRRSGLLL